MRASSSDVSSVGGGEVSPLLEPLGTEYGDEVGSYGELSVGESLISEDVSDLVSPGFRVGGEHYGGIEVCAPGGVLNGSSSSNIGGIHWEEYLVQIVG